MKRWKKWVLRTGLGLLATGGVFALVEVGVRYTARRGGEARLAEVTAAIDATDPGWRLDDILAAREAKFPPDGQNVMALVEKVHPRQSAVFREWNERQQGWLESPELNHLPDPDDAREAVRVRDACLDVIGPAREVRHMTSPGGYHLDVPPNVLNTLLPRSQNLRGLVALLWLDAIVFALNGDSVRAVESTQAALVAARGIGDEPFLISMLVRIATTIIAKTTAERVLAWGEPRTGLDVLQATFAAEAEAPLMTIGLRGERAAFDRLFDNIDRGVLGVSDLSEAADKSFNPQRAVGEWLYRGYLPGDRARFLEIMTRLIAISREPAHDRRGHFEQEEADFRAWASPRPPDRQYLLTSLLMPAWGKIATSDLRAKANLRAAAAGIACERFRQANKRWPKDLAEIPKGILPEIPLDPFDGQPLRYRRTDDGVVIYSVGQDLQDDDGHLSAKGEPGTDLGFRLWDPAHRRAAPLPKPEPADEPGPP